MDTWPTAPLTTILEGECEGNPIGNALAKHEPNYSDRHQDTYVITTGPHAGESIAKGWETDGIWEWEEVVVIPADVIKLLEAAFANTGLTLPQATALQATISYAHPQVRHPSL